MKKKGMRPVDYILIIGTVVAPMTGWRALKIGPGEVLCLIWALQSLRFPAKFEERNFLRNFWLPFYAVICLGALYGILFYPNESDRTGILTWFYLMCVSCGVYRGLHRRDTDEVETILEKICVLSAVWYLFLYMYGVRVSGHFLGAPLWYGYRRFSGGGTNPHQIAVLMSGLIFASVRFALKYKGRFMRQCKHVCCAAIGLFIALETKSSTLVASVVLTIIVGAVLAVLHRARTRLEKALYVSLVAVTTISLLALFGTVFAEGVYRWIASDPNGLGRMEIFRTIGIALKKNPIFGLGPGGHAYDGTMEFHNTYLEILAMTGVVGFFIFAKFSLRIYRVLKSDYTLYLIVLPLYAYGFAGFSMRRLVYWNLIVLAVVLAQKKGKGENLVKRSGLPGIEDQAILTRGS